MFLLFLFKTHLDLNSCDFWFLIFFYLVKINKLINFFNLDADVAFFNVKKTFFIINLGHVDINLLLFIPAICHGNFLRF